MANTEKIDQLIATVRELNHTLRPRLTEEIGGGSGPMAQVHEIIGEMRDRELITSHGIKTMILSNREGVDAAEIQNMMGTAGSQITLEEALAIHDPVSTMPTREVISAFATAREAILSLIRELPDAAWTEESTQAGVGGKNSVAAIVDGLLSDDKAAMARITQLLG